MPRPGLISCQPCFAQEGEGNHSGKSSAGEHRLERNQPVSSTERSKLRVRSKESECQSRHHPPLVETEQKGWIFSYTGFSGFPGPAEKMSSHGCFQPSYPAGPESLPWRPLCISKWLKLCVGPRHSREGHRAGKRGVQKKSMVLLGTVLFLKASQCISELGETCLSVFIYSACSPRHPDIGPR